MARQHEQWYEHERTWYPASEMWLFANEQAECARKAPTKRHERRAAMASVLFAHFAFESYLNVACETLLGETLWAAMRSGRTLGVEDKLGIVEQKLGCTDTLAGKEPFQTALATKKLRNFAAHARPQTGKGQAVSYTPKVKPSMDEVAPTEAEKLCTADNAEDAVSAVLESTRQLTKLSQDARDAGTIPRSLASIGHLESATTRHIPKPAI